MNGPKQPPKTRGLNFIMGKAYGLAGKREEMENYKKRLQQLGDEVIKQQKRLLEDYTRQITTISAELEKLEKARTRSPEKSTELESKLSGYISKLQYNLDATQESLLSAEKEFEQKLLAMHVDLLEMEEGYAYGDALRHQLTSKK